MSKPNLKPCPFCGAEAEIRAYNIACTNENCWISDTLFYEAGHWNHRPLEDAKDARIKELEAALNKIDQELNQE